jgi:hypothetical protein
MGAPSVIPSVRLVQTTLGERLHDHHEHDSQRDHTAGDPEDPRLSGQLLVFGRGLARRLEHLDLPIHHPRVEADGHHDQENEEDQGASVYQLMIPSLTSSQASIQQGPHRWPPPKGEGNRLGDCY